MSVLMLVVMFLAVGCEGGDAGVKVKVKEGGKKKAGGEELWTEACAHSIELMKKSEAMKDVPRDQLEKVMEGAAEECLEEFKKVGGDGADDAANCVLKLERFDPAKFAACEPKKRSYKEERRDEGLNIFKKESDSGEEHWAEACDYAVELMKTDDMMKDVPKDQLDKALEGAAKECREEFRKVGGAEADEAASCVLELETFDAKEFSKCEPKKRGEKK